MQIKTLYKYTRPGGGVTTSIIEFDAEHTTAYRLIADEGKVLTRDGVTFTGCIDVEDPAGWYEVDEPEINGKEE